MRDTTPLLEVEALHTSFHTDDGTVRAVNGVSFSMRPAERLAVVGESGCGKSAMALSLIRLISWPGAIDSGRVVFGGQDLLAATENELNHIRGKDIGAVFQDPMTSLDPVMRVEDQMTVPIRRHRNLGKAQARERAVSLLGAVGIPDPTATIERYPFELSGGMRQRVLIAMAMSCKPRLIIADEPTTALDVTIQAQIVQLLKDLTEQTGTSMLFITHDLGLVARFAHNVAVMYAGRIVEYGEVRQIFANPRHPYTQSLLRTLPRITGPRAERLAQIGGLPPDMRRPLSGCAFVDRCPIAIARCETEAPPLTERGDGHLAACWKPDGIPSSSVANFAVATEPVSSGSERPQTLLHIHRLAKHFVTQARLPWQKSSSVKAVNGVDLLIHRGETVGIVGESGCGKSTMARLLLSLETPTDGEIAVYDRRIDHATGAELIRYRQSVQMIFQDPYSSFNPRMRIEQIITEPLDVMGIGDRADRGARARELVRVVGLEPDHLQRFPSQLSGGQRQRVAIARALALKPAVIVADEPTSALDVSIRAQIINLMSDLKRDMGLSFVFISHDLSTVRHISDTVAVMYLGELVEVGPAEEIFADPRHPYTKALLAAVPVPDPAVEAERAPQLLRGDLPSPSNPPSGCSFHTRCPRATDYCAANKPEQRTIDGRKVACHYAE